ncbi:MAG TPA: hypothetical protein PKM58_05340 [Pyrinomonadaceae bacterium]|nr:hypothetical protein [Pyrinomonadaceae bacterium]
MAKMFLAGFFDHFDPKSKSEIFAIFVLYLIPHFVVISVFENGRVQGERFCEVLDILAVSANVSFDLRENEVIGIHRKKADSLKAAWIHLFESLGIVFGNYRDADRIQIDIVPSVQI